MPSQKVMEVQCDFRLRANDARAMLVIVESDEFVRLYDISNEKQQKEVEKLIEGLQKESLKEWVAFHPSKTKEEWPLNTLKELAYQHGVPNYSRMRKYELARVLDRIMK